MEDTNKVYRIRTAVGDDAPNVIHVPLNQSYDMFEILSLKLNQTNAYKTYDSDYGVIVGRVTANGGFGIPNAKVSIFIEVSDDETLKNRLLYNFTSVTSTDNDGVRYNVLPDFVDDACHQDVGTFPNKRLVLDNQDIIEIFDKYWKYTTTTNHAGDYMLFGIPTGSQQLHVDVDLSDCGILSQRPRDMIGKGYNANMFESPNKFKYSTNLNSLAQIVSQDRGLYVYPYWGDVTDGDDKFSITRCDINLEYKFESYAVFIGSIVTDKGSNAIGKNCTGTEQNGKMSDLIAGEGTIEMIRKTLDNKVEEYPIMGNRLIDGDGVWCYQIPMNLDYVTTDEFGNIVPTDNPDKGIATRTRVRFRISLDENPNDATARKRARYLVPNNPRIGDEDFTDELEADYEFGSMTRDESYCDMFWNKVYTVKNYIPKLQKNSKETNRKHTGIKLINHYGDNNPMPYNALTIKLGLTYRLICVIVKVFILLVGFLNNVISILGAIPCWIANIKISLGFTSIRPFKGALKYIPGCISLSSEFCDDGINPNIYYPGCGKPFGCVWDKKTKVECQKEQSKLPKEDQKICSNSSSELYTCVENELAQQNDATSFNFYNDWVNGVLYAPLWYRKIRPKRKFFFGLFSRRAKDEWCTANKYYDTLRIMQACAVVREQSTANRYQNFDGNNITPYYPVKDNKQTKECKKKECNKSKTNVNGMYGVILNNETILGDIVYYYKSVEYDPTLLSNDNLLIENKPQGEIKLLFATDIVLLGSLNDCDMNGVPQFFKSLESTTYNMPTDILFTDHEIEHVYDTKGELIESIYTEESEMAGCDWGNKNEYGKEDGGLFYSIGCSDITMTTKSCINLSRICEYGVSLDETKQIPDLSTLESKGDEAFESLITDGFVSWDELYNLDERSMFATMNGNKLKTKLNYRNGLYEYDFRYLYPENFDGSLHDIMEETTKKYKSEVTYRHNYKLENFSRDYYIFRMGNNPYFYDQNHTFARYENSFYFYFGLKAGKTAIEKFNSKYFAECINPNAIESQIGIKYEPNSWCSEVNNTNDGYLALDFSRLSMPYDLTINGVSDSSFSFEIYGMDEEKIYFSNTPNTKLEEKSYKQMKIDNDGYYSENGNAVAMFDNGSYLGNLVDGDGNIIEFRITIEGKYLTFKTDVQHFKQPNNVLGDNYSSIANNTEGLDTNSETKQVTRTIGGVITITDIYVDNKKVDNYRVEVRPEKELSNYNGSDFNNRGSHSNGVIKYDNTNEIYGIGVGKGDVIYNVSVIETCGGQDSNNVVTKRILVQEPLPYKMYINDVDYDLIKNFNKVNGQYTDGWNPNGKIGKAKPEMTNNNQYAPNYRDVFFSGNPWFNLNNVWSNDRFKGIGNLQTIEDVSDINTFIQQVNSRTLNIVSAGTPVEKTLNTPQDTWKDANGVTHTVSTEPNSEDLIGSTVNDYVNYKTFTLNDLLSEFTRPSVGGNVYYNWDGEYIVKDYNASTFNATTQQYNEDNIYDLLALVNDFIENVNDVADLRNDLPSLMKSAFYLTCNETPKTISISVQTSDMPYRTTLVLQEETANENSNAAALNTLTSNNMTVNYESYVSDVNIPTITYACNELYGVEGRTDYRPVVAQVKNGKRKYQKHPYYVGTVNDAKATIPRDSSITVKKVGDINQIDEKNAVSLLFDFPMIDMVLNFKYIAWAFMDEIPFYKKAKKYITGYRLKQGASGVFSGYSQNVDIDTYNALDNVTAIGYVSRQNVNDFKPLNYDFGYVLISDNGQGISTSRYNSLDEDTQSLYMPYDVERYYRSVTAKNIYESVYQDYYYVLKRDKSQTKTISEYNALSENDKKLWEIAYDLRDVVMNGSLGGNIFNGSFTNDELETQTLCGMKLKFSENLIRPQEQTYVEKRILLGYDGDEILDGLISFTNYIVDENYTADITQYAPMLPMQTMLTLEDDTCSINETIYGGMRIELGDESVNDCVNHTNILDVYVDGGPQNMIYSVISLRRQNNMDYEYPLNYAEAKDFISGDDTDDEYSLFKIDNEIKDKYASGKEYNVFSYKMIKQYFMNDDDTIVDKRYHSEMMEQRTDGSTSSSRTKGYGSTGRFEYKLDLPPSNVWDYVKEMYMDYDPVFVVAQTNNNCRVISCVYDFSYVGGILKYGTLERKNVEITTNEQTGETTYTIQEVTKDKKLGMGVKEGHFYLDNYKYNLYGNCKLNSVTTIEFPRNTLYGRNQLVFASITDQIFDEIKSKFKSRDSLKSVIKNTEINAIDRTDLRHLCGIDADDIDPNPTTWYTYIWFANLPKDENHNEYTASEDNGGIYHNGEWYNYIEMVHEKGEYVDVMQTTNPRIADLPYSEFLGWTENQPNVNGPFVDFTTEANSKANECKVYFGNWRETTVQTNTVQWVDNDEIYDDGQPEPTEEYLFELIDGQTSYSLGPESASLHSVILTSNTTTGEMVIYDTDYIFDQEDDLYWINIISQSPDATTNEMNFYISVSENAGTTQRSGKVVFTQRNSGKTITVTIVQRGS